MTDTAGRRAIGRRDLFSWCGGAAVALAGMAAPSRAAGLTALRVGCVPDVTGLPAWVARDKGLFERNGLDVALVAAPHTGLETLGEFEVATASPPELVKAWQDGVDVAAVAGEAVETRDSPVTHLIVRAGSPIHGVADLKGKTVAFPALGAIIHVSTLHVAKQNGVDPGTVYAVEASADTMSNELRAGNVDAVGVGEPVAGQLLAAGNRSIGDPLFSVGDEVASLFWVAGRRWSQKNPDVVAAFVTSLEQARDAIAADPDEARRILAAYARLPAPAVERTPFPTYRFTTNVDARQWAAILKDIGEPARRRGRDQGRRKPAAAPEPEREPDQKPEAVTTEAPPVADPPKPDAGAGADARPDARPDTRPDTRPKPDPDAGTSHRGQRSARQHHRGGGGQRARPPLLFPFSLLR